MANAKQTKKTTRAPAKAAAAKRTVAKRTTGSKSTKTTTARKPATTKPAARKPRRRRQTLIVDRAKGAKFSKEGLREQFVYRHFGVEESTHGEYAAHVIRAADGKPPIRHHTHPDCEFLLVYVLKGWVKFWYEGRGEEKLNVGDVHMLPPGIKHAVTGWSKDLEMLEVTHPAQYQSIELTDRQIAALG